MQTFTVEVKETLSRLVNIEARDLKDAIEIASKQYNSGEIVLDYDDYRGNEILPYEG